MSTRLFRAKQPQSWNFAALDRLARRILRRFRRVSPSHRAAARVRFLRAEPLEERALLAGLSGLKTIGSSGADYQTITAAAADIQNNGLAGALLLELQSNYTSASEASPINLANLGTSSTNTITIRPAGNATNLSIVNNDPQALATISFDAGSFVTIDGRSGGAGTAKQLTIANTNSLGSAVQFINESLNNTVEYVALKGANTQTTPNPGITTVGVVFFGGTVSLPFGVNGNDNNTIDHCDISDGGSGLPVNAVYSLGATETAARNNNANVISNSNIYNFNANADNVNSAGVRLDGGNADWTIIGNSFYQVGIRTPFNNAIVRPIFVNNPTGNNFKVINNVIGGSAPNAGGSAWSLNANIGYKFVGIQLNVGGTTPSSIQGNTIQNIAWTTNTSASPLPGIWSGIYIPTGSGSVNIGTITGNTIGSSSGSGSITVTTSGTAASGTVFGIGSDSGGTIAISNNAIGSITANGPSTSGASIVGIQVTAGTNTISGNTIGSTTTANSLNAATSATSATIGQQLSGIVSTAANGATITNNTIAKLNNNYTGTAATGQIRGIVTTSSSNTITGNTVQDLSTTSQNTGTAASQAVLGIAQSSTTSLSSQTVSQNTVSGLSDSALSGGISVTGIYYTGATSGTNTIARNLVYGLAMSSTTPSSVVNGMLFDTGTFTAQNNMVDVGLAANGSSTAGSSSVRGIYDSTTSSGRTFYHNSVYVGGAQTSNNSTFAFISAGISNTRDFRNNIFFNGRTTSSGSGKNFAVSYGGSVNLTADNNIFYATGTAGHLGQFAGSDKDDITLWRNATTKEAASIYTDPLFVNPAASIPNLHLKNASPANAAGFDTGNESDDFDGELRSNLTPVDIGADAYKPSVIVPALDGSGNLTITDVDSTDTSNDITVSVSGSSLVITEAHKPFPLYLDTPGVLSNDNKTITIANFNSVITGALIFNTGGGSDLVTVNFSGGNPIPAGGITYNGGESTLDDDRLKLTGYSLITADGTADITVNHTGPEAGNVVFAGLGTVFFSQTEPLALRGDAADLVINLPSGPNTDTTLGDDGVNGFDGTANNDANTSAIYDSTDPHSFEFTEFTNPTNTLKINTGSASDNLSIGSLVASGLDADLTIGTAAAGFNSIAFTGPITLTGGKGLTATATKWISLSASTTITTDSGDVMLSANHQQTASAGDFVGIEIPGGKIQSTSGDITLTGRGGTGPVNQIGVYIHDIAVIGNHTTGAISISGQGGDSPVGSSGGNVGVRIENGNAISTSGEAITIAGLGGSDGDNLGGNHGVLVISSNINADGTGVLSVTGQAATLPENSGIDLEGGSNTGSKITLDGAGGSGVVIGSSSVTASADLEITGTGNSSGSFGFNSTSTVNTLNVGTINITADTMNLGGTIDAAGGIVTLLPKSLSKPIDLGANDSGSTLGLTSSEINVVFAATINIGDSKSGAITVSADINRDKTGDINLTSGAAISFSGGLVNTKGSDLTLAPASTATASFGKSGTDVNVDALPQAGTLAFMSGTNLGFNINTNVEDTGFQVLNVAGNLDLTGTDLTVTGNAHPVAGDKFIIARYTGTLTGSFASPTVTLGGTTLTVFKDIPGQIYLAVPAAATLDAQLDPSGNLTVTDSDGNKNNNLTVSVSSGSLIISDANEAFISAPPGGVLTNAGKTLVFANFSSDVTGFLAVNSAGGNDTLTLDYCGGALPSIINIDPGSGADSVIVQGTSGDDVAVLKKNGNADQLTWNSNTINIAPLANLENLTINGQLGDDKFTVDFVNGEPTPSGGLTFNGGTGTAAGDLIYFKGSGSQTAAYAPDPATVGNGQIGPAAGGGTSIQFPVKFTGIEGLDASNLGGLTVITPNGNDNIHAGDGASFFNPAVAALRISATSGGVDVQTVALWNVSGTLTIDAGVNDGNAASANDIIDIGTATLGDFGPIGAPPTGAGNANIGFLDFETGNLGTDAVNVNGEVILNGNFKVVTGAINVNGSVWNLATASLSARGSITDGNGTATNLKTSALSATAGTGIELDTITNVFGLSTTNGDITIRNTIGSAPALDSAIATNGNIFFSTANDTGSLQVNTVSALGNVTLTNAIQSGSTTTISGSISGASLLLYTPDVSIGGTIITSGATTIQADSGHSNRPISFGTETVGSLSLTDGELDQITASRIVVGSTSAGAVTFSGPISPAHSNSLDIITGSTINDTGSSSVFNGANLSLNAASGIGTTSSLNISATNLAATAAAGGVNISSTGDMHLTTVGTVSGITATGASATITTPGALTVDAAVTGGSGGISLSSDSDGDAVGSFTLSASGSIATSSNGPVSIAAPDVSLLSTVNAGSGTTLIVPSVANRAIDLGTKTAGKLSLTDSELDRITSGTLRIGKATSGAITISSTLDLTNNTTSLHLISGSKIIDGNAVGTDLIVTNLTASAVGGIGNGNPLEIQITKFAASNSGSGNIEISNSGGSTTVAGVDGLFGVINSGGGNINLTGTGDITVSSAINANTGAVNLTSIGNEHLLTINLSIIAGANSVLIADKMAINAPVNVGTKSVTLAPEGVADGGDAIQLGSDADAAGNALELSDGELYQITAGTINIGDSNSGAITVAADISRPSSTNMALISGGDVLISGGQVNTAGGTLLLHPGTSPSAVKPTQVGTDATASAVSFGSDLSINIDGTTVDTEYSQLKVSDTVDLTGVTLVLTGSFVPSNESSFTIVSAATRTGFFNNLPAEGSTLSFHGKTLVAHYTADGVVLGVQNAAIVGGDLVLDVGSGRTDDITIVVEGNNYLISDPTATNTFVTTIPGATGNFTNTLSVPKNAVSGQIRLITGDLNDRLTVDFSGGDFANAISYDGGTQSSTPGDLLKLTGGTFATVSHTFASAGAGSITLGSNSISYTGLEPVDMSGIGSGDLSFTLPSIASTAFLEDDGTTNNSISQIRSAGGTFETTTFANPTGSLTVNRGNAADSLTVSDLLDFNASLAIGAMGAEVNTVTFAGVISLATNNSISANALGAIRLPNSTSKLAVKGTGAISLTTARSISLSSGSSVTSVNGNIMLSANQQATPTSGNFTGVDVNGATIQATSTGAVTVQGTAGDSNAISQYGVRVRSIAIVKGGTAGLQVIGIGRGSAQSSGGNEGVSVETSAQLGAAGTGPVNVQGTGGVGSLGANHGVSVTSTITSDGGTVHVVGQGGVESSYGVYVGAAGLVSSGGTGDNIVEGTGDGGVYLAGGLVTSSGGNVQVVGQGRTISPQNCGVVLNGGIITAGGVGAVSVTGTGGTTSSDLNIGVWVDDATINSSGGNVTVTGQGGGSGTSANNAGVRVQSGQISAGGLGAVVVRGTGGSGLGDSNDGVFVGFNSATITSSGGNVEVIGIEGSGNSGIAIFTRTSGSISTAVNGGTLTLIGNSMSFDSTSTIAASATSSVTIHPFTIGAAINLGLATDPAGGALGLSDAELDHITAGTLRIGDLNSGPLSITNSISRHAGYSTLSLITGDTSAAAITQSAPLSVANLAVQSSGTATLGNTNNDIDKLAVSVAGLGHDFNFTDATGFALSTVDGVLGVQTGTGGTGENIVLTAGGSVTQASGACLGTNNLLLSGTGSFTLTDPANNIDVLAANTTGPLTYQDINVLDIGIVNGTAGITTASTAVNVTTINGPLTVRSSGPVSAGNSSVSLTAGTTTTADQLLTVSGALNGAGGVTLIADNMSFGAAISAGTATAAIRPTSTGTAINLGGSDSTGTLGLMDSELDFVTADTIVIGADGSVAYPGNPTGPITVSSPISHAGDDNITVVTAKNIAVNANWTSTNGDLTFRANQQTPSASGNFIGIAVAGAAISTGGNLTLLGRGGDTGGRNAGVEITNGASLSGGGGGKTTSITGTGGTGGAGSTLGYDGIRIIGSGSSVSSSGGNVQLTGIGGTSAGLGTGDGNFGVWIFSGNIISAGGSGNVQIDGTGGSNPEGYNHGVEIEGSVTAAGGDISLTGVANQAGTTYDHHGVRVVVGGQVTGTAGHAVTITGSGGGGPLDFGLVFFSSAITASGGGPINLVADSIDLGTQGSATIDAGSSGTVTVRQKTNGTLIDLGGADIVTGSAPYTLGLNSTEISSVTAGTLNIGNSNAGAITISDSIVRNAGSTTAINLTAGSGKNIDFGASGSVDAKNGNVTLQTNSSGSGAITSGGLPTDIFAANLSLTAGSGGIGATGNPLVFAATNLNADTGGNANQFLSLSTVGAATIDSTGLSAGTGTIELDGGTFTLGGSNRINDNTKLNVHGATFAIGTNNETVGGITLTSGGITGDTGFLTSTGTIQTQTGSISAKLAGSVGLIQSSTGTTTLSGANSYTGDTIITNGTLKLGASEVIPDGTGKGNAILNPASGNTATLDLGGFSETINGLSSSGSGSKVVDNSAMGGPFTLSVGGNDATSTFGGVIRNSAGMVSLTKIGTGTLTLGGVNTYSGQTTINQGTLKVTSGDAIPDTSDVTISASANLDLANTEKIGGLYGLGLITGTNTQTSASLTVINGGDFAGTISGSTNLIVNGPGKTLVLGGVGTYAGGTGVLAGTLLVTGTFSGGGFWSAESGATLGGTGNINPNSIGIEIRSGGHLAPGVGGPGTLNSRNVRLDVGANFDVLLDGTTAGSQYSQQNVTGTVIAGPLTTLNIALGFTPTVGDTFTIINNDSTDAIVGTFSGLPEGKVFSLTTGSFAGRFQVTYRGGDGNDVVLKTVSTSAPALDGTPGDDNWLVKRNADTTHLDITLNGTLIYSPLYSSLAKLSINGLDGNDTLTVDDSNGSAIPDNVVSGIRFSGGANTTADKLVVTGGNQGSVSYNYTDYQTGSITNAFGTISFSQTEQLANTNIGTGTISDITVNLPISANSISLGDDGVTTNTLSRLTGSTIPQTDFANPTGSLIIEHGNSADAIIINAVPNFNAGLAIGTVGSEFAGVTFADALSLAANKELEVNATGSISLPNATSNLAVSGTGAVSFKTARDISVGNGASIKSENGPIILFANQQATTTGTFVGVDINGTLSQPALQVTGSGGIFIVGNGGNTTGSSQYGVHVGGAIAGGTGGISITGAGGGTGLSTASYGVYVDASAITATGTGVITVQGTGGPGTGVSSYGLFVFGSNASIRSSGGDVQVVGHGGGSTSGGSGVVVQAGQITAGAIGSLSVQGFGGPGSGLANQGVFLLGSNALLSAGGSVIVSGVEGGGTTGLAIATNGGTVSSPSAVTLIADSINLFGNPSVSGGSSGSVTVRPFVGKNIDLGPTSDTVGSGGSLALSDAELDAITAGTINIGDATTGSISLTTAIDRAAGSTTAIKLTTGINKDILLGGGLDAKNGSVTLLTNVNGSGVIISGTATVDITAASVSLTAGSGGIGQDTNPVILSATNLNTSTPNTNQFLQVAGPTTIDATGLSAGTGTIRLSGGTLQLGGSNRIDDKTTLDISGPTFDIGTFSDTVGGVTLEQGSITGTTGILTSKTTFQTQSGLISAILGGNVGLTQSSVGTTILSGNNTYAGTTTISAGTLQIGDGGTTGSLGTGNVIDSGTLVFNRTLFYRVDNAISGNGGVTFSNGQVNFTAANTYTGTTLISSAGSLFLGSGTTTGSLSPSSAIIDNGLFGCQRTNTLTQGVDFASVISGTGAVWGAIGNLVLNGLNAYTRTTWVVGGRITFNSIKNIGEGASALGAPTSAANGTIGLGSQGGTSSSTLVYNGSSDTTNRVIDLRGTTGPNATLDQSGTGLLKFTSAFTATGASSKTLTLQGSTSGTGEIAGAIVNNSPTNTTSLTKAGTGLWSLSGNNTYTGATTVSAGTLLINGSITSNVTVVSGATLGGKMTGAGSGTINGTINVASGGHLAPGSSAGILNSRNLTLASGANFDIELNGATAGSGYDQQNVTGAVDLTGSSLNLTLGFTPAVGNTFTIINNDSSDAITGSFNGLPEGKIFSATTGSFSGTFQITYQGGDGNDVVLTALSATDPALQSTPGDDEWLVKRNSDDIHLDITLNGTIILSPLYASLTSLSISGLGGNDTLTVDFSAGNAFPSGGITFDGGTSTTPGDRLILINGSEGTVTYGYTDNQAGTVTSSLGKVTYKALEQLYNRNISTDITLNLPPGPNVAILVDSGTSNIAFSRLSAASIAQTDFANPSVSLTINRCNAADTLTVYDLSNFTAGLNIGSAGSEFSTVTFAGAVSLAANKSVSVMAGAITINASLMTSGGSITLSATGDITLNNALSSDGGQVSLIADSDANGGGTVILSDAVLGSYLQQSQLMASGGASGDYFGISAALSSDGNTAILGSHSDVGANVRQGSAYIFVRTGGVWTEQQQLVAMDGAANDLFGVSVALSNDGNTAIVGADSDDVGATVDQGSAYVFTRTGGIWAQQQQLTASDGAFLDSFGWSVTLSGDGNTAIVGAYRDDIVQADQGSAYVFTRTGGAWTQQQKITANDGDTADAFGFSVALSNDGNTVLVGAVEGDIGPVTGQGLAYVFVRAGDVWTQQQRLAATGGASGDNFGWSVALSSDGNTAVVGAQADDVGANEDQGSVYVFTRTGNVWTPQQQLTATSGAAYNYFGVSVALSNDGNTVLVGAADIGTNDGRGSAYVLTRTGGVWTQRQQLTAIGGAAGNSFGASVALSNDMKTVLAGAYGYDVGPNGPRGSAYTFVSTVGSIVAGGGDVSIQAADVDIQGSISSMGTVSFIAQGRDINLGTSTTGSLSLTDAELDQVAAGTLQIGNSTSGPITISAAIALPTATPLNLTSGGSINFANGSIDTAGGNLRLMPGSGGSVGPASAGTDAMAGAGSISFAGGSDLASAINGTTVDTEYDQLNVVGKINLTGVNLALSGTYSPTVGDKFTIVKNDSTDDLIGEFNNLADGQTFYIATGALAGSYSISYHGGDGNDAVITRVNVPPSFTIPPNQLNQSAYDEVDDITHGPAHEQVVPWATNISKGGQGESGQQLTFHIDSIDDPSLFAVPPTIDADGTLHYTPMPNRHGTATIAVTLHDDGGGTDTSDSQQFTIEIKKRHKLHNAADTGNRNGRDVTGATSLPPDGFIVANDVLAVINYINAKGSGPIPDDAPFGPSYPDVNADDNVAADDVIIVINWINSHPGQSEGEAPVDLTSSSDSYFDALAADQAAQTTVASVQPVAAATTSTSMADIVSLLAADIASSETKRRRL